MKRSRRNHSSKFKARVALEALRGDATLSEPGVHATQIAAWRKQALEHLSEVVDNGNPGVEDAERQIRDLQAKVGELTMERDVLAGALGCFADSPEFRGGNLRGRRRQAVDEDGKRTIPRNFVIRVGERLRTAICGFYLHGRLDLMNRRRTSRLVQRTAAVVAQIDDDAFGAFRLQRLQRPSGSGAITVVGTRGPTPGSLRTSASRLAASVAAVKEPTGVLAKLAAVEAGDVEVAEARDGLAEMREQHAGHAAKRWGLVPPEHTGVDVAGMLDLDGEGALALEGRHCGHGGALIDPMYRIALR